MKFDPKLKEFAVGKQLNYLEAIELTDYDVHAAAKSLGVDNSLLYQAVRRVSKKAARQGFAPDHDYIHPQPAGMQLSGVSLRRNSDGKIDQRWDKSKPSGMPESEAIHLPDPKTLVKLSTLYNSDGDVSLQWAQEKPELAAQKQLWLDWAEGLKEEIPHVGPTEFSGNRFLNPDLLAGYPIGDHHLGMLAWDKETGADYDIKIGERLLMGAFDYLVGAAPAAETGLLVVLGDFLHYDGFAAVTPTSKNVLDSDTRFPKMAKTAVRSLRGCVSRMLTKHKDVHIIVEIGNHDLASSVWLMVSLEALYEDEPRVTVDISPQHYHYYQFGKTMLMTHHGHGAKADKLPMIAAQDQPRMWGDTTKRYGWIGHLHHLARYDFVGMEIEQFRVLATQDAWAAQKGFRSTRDMKQITFHREFGEVSRNTVTPEMF